MVHYHCAISEHHHSVSKRWYHHRTQKLFPARNPDVLKNLLEESRSRGKLVKSGLVQLLKPYFRISEVYGYDPRQTFVTNKRINPTNQQTHISTPKKIMNKKTWKSTQANNWTALIPLDVSWQKATMALDQRFISADWQATNILAKVSPKIYKLNVFQAILLHLQVATNILAKNH